MSDMITPTRIAEIRARLEAERYEAHTDDTLALLAALDAAQADNDKRQKEFEELIVGQTLANIATGLNCDLDCEYAPQMADEYLAVKAERDAATARAEQAEAALSTEIEYRELLGRQLNTEIPRLTSERDAIQKSKDSVVQNWMNLHDEQVERAEQAETEATALRAEVARLREGLGHIANWRAEPFSSGYAEGVLSEVQEGAGDA